jgi:hypothetical protein
MENIQALTIREGMQQALVLLNAFFAYAEFGMEERARYVELARDILAGLLEQMEDKT